MKHSSLFFLVIMLLFFSCNNRNGYRIEGRIDGIEKGRVYLGKKASEHQYEITPVDSAVIRNGRFVLKGSVKYPVRRYLKVDGEVGDIPLFLENTKISVESAQAEYPAAKISGSPLQKAYDSYLDTSQRYDHRIDSLSELLNKAIVSDQQNKAEALQYQYAQLQRDKMDYTTHYLLSDAPSVVRLFVYNRSHILYPKHILDSLYHSLDPAVYETPHIQTLKRRIAEIKRVQPGEPFIDLTLRDTAGKEVALSDYTGKDYVLLYFVHKCPHINLVPKGFQRIYKKYHHKGLELFGVYTDSDRFYWEHTIDKHDLKWPFVSDLKGSQSKAYKKYGRSNTPFHYLIGKDGTFIGRYRSAQEIEQELERIFQGGPSS